MPVRHKHLKDVHSINYNGKQGFDTAGKAGVYSHNHLIWLKGTHQSFSPLDLNGLLCNFIVRLNEMI